MGFVHGELTEQIIKVSFAVHTELGAGFLESVYQNALVMALRQAGLSVKAQYPLSVTFRGQVVGEFVADILVEDKVIVEIKAVRAVAKEHVAQVINYLKATGIEVGMLINFGAPSLEYNRLHK